MAKEKKLYSMEDEVLEKINNLSVDLKVDKSQVVNIAVKDMESSFKLKKIKVTEKKKAYLKRIKLLDEELDKINEKIKQEKEVFKVLEKERKRFKKIIKKKFDDGNELEGIGIAKRMSNVLKCDYLDLIPL